MKIAILGWGSLIWQPKDLKFDIAKGWQNDGPMLPIEFARISKDGRLTLVITPEETEVQTLYAVSKYETLEEAVLDLAVREGSGRYSIGYYDKTKNEFSHEVFFNQNIIDWMNTKDFDAVIWTNLKENWKDKTNDRIDYLKELKGNTRALAEEYIRKTPCQIKTKYRNQIEQQLKWLPML